MVDHEPATPGYNYVYNCSLIVDNLLARGMQPGTLTQEYTASLQEGGLLVLSRDKADGAAILAAAEGPQVADV